MSILDAQCELFYSYDNSQIMLIVFWHLPVPTPLNDTGADRNDQLQTCDWSAAADPGLLLVNCDKIWIFSDKRSKTGYLRIECWSKTTLGWEIRNHTRFGIIISVLNAQFNWKLSAERLIQLSLLVRGAQWMCPHFFHR